MFCSEERAPSNNGTIFTILFMTDSNKFSNYLLHPKELHITLIIIIAHVAHFYYYHFNFFLMWAPPNDFGYQNIFTFYFINYCNLLRFYWEIDYSMGLDDEILGIFFAVLRWLPRIQRLFAPRVIRNSKNPLNLAKHANSKEFAT